MEKRSLFHNIFIIALVSGSKLHIHLLNVVIRFIFSSILQIWYVKVLIYQSISESPLDLEITRIYLIRKGSEKIAFNQKILMFFPISITLVKELFQSKVLIFFLFLHKNILSGTHWKHLAEALLMSTHNICFYGEIEKKYYVDTLSYLEL